MHKCPFCGGEYQLATPPAKEKIICYIPNSNITGTQRFPDRGLLCETYICQGCGNIQLFSPAQK